MENQKLEDLNTNMVDEKKDNKILEQQRAFGAESRAEKVEEMYEELEEKTDKEEKRLTNSMMIIFAILIILATLFVLSYMNGARVISG